jgi:hypothetical protein
MDAKFSMANKFRADEDEEYPRAYIVPRKESSVTAIEIEHFVNSKVSKVKRLTGGVVFTDSIPKNPVIFHTLTNRNYYTNQIVMIVWQNSAKAAARAREAGVR